MEKYEKDTLNLTATIVKFTNPFPVEANDLSNLVTNSVVPENIKEDLCKHGEIGNKLFGTLLRSVSRVKLQTCGHQ